jgi:hypothetical protein
LRPDQALAAIETKPRSAMERGFFVRLGLIMQKNLRTHVIVHCNIIDAREFRPVSAIPA